MENINQEYHCQSIVCNDSYQIIDSCNQRTGCNRRVHVDFVEKHWHNGADHAGNYHGHNQ